MFDILLSILMSFIASATTKFTCYVNSTVTNNLTTHNTKQYALNFWMWNYIEFDWNKIVIKIEMCLCKTKKYQIKSEKQKNQSHFVFLFLTANDGEGDGK